MSILSMEHTESCIQDVITTSAAKAISSAFQKLQQSGLFSPDNAERIVAQHKKIAAAVESTLEKVITEILHGITGVLRRVYGDQIFEIGENDGTETLADADDICIGFSVVPSAPSRPTPDTAVALYDQIEAATYTQIFLSFNLDLDLLVLEESQVLAFRRRYSAFLRESGCGTFFLVKRGGEFYVIDLRILEDDSLEANSMSLWSLGAIQSCGRAVIPFHPDLP